jgi:hypothetical protein
VAIELNVDHSIGKWLILDKPVNIAPFKTEVKEDSTVIKKRGEVIKKLDMNDSTSIEIEETVLSVEKEKQQIPEGPKSKSDVIESVELESKAILEVNDVGWITMNQEGDQQ